MALVGSGTSQIQNFVAAGTLAPAAMDLSFAAVVEQMGGVKWLNGSPARVAGNLDASNFVADMALPNSNKVEARALSVLQFLRSGGTSTPGFFYLGSVTVSVPTRIVSLSGCDLEPSLATAPEAQVSFVLLVDGAEVATMTTGVAGSVGNYYRRARKPIGVDVAAGSIIAVYSTLIQNPTVASLVLATEHE